MKNITDNIELIEHCGNFVPKDPWNFEKHIKTWENYFTTQYKQILKTLA